MRAAQEPRKSTEAMDHLTSKLAPHVLGKKSCRVWFGHIRNDIDMPESCRRSTKQDNGDKDENSAS